MAIRAVTFDFWGTLYCDAVDVGMKRRERRSRQIQAVLGAMKISLSPEQIHEAIAALERRASAEHRTEQRTMNKDQIGQSLAECLGQTLHESAAETLGDVITGAIVHHPPALADGAFEALRKLEGRYRMAVICDTRLSVGESLRQVMGNDLVLDFFETQTFSDETPFSKPSADQFLHTIGLMGIDPAEAVHVGDNERLDIHGAKEAGMHAVLVRGRAAANHTRADAVIETLAELPAALEAMA